MSKLLASGFARLKRDKVFWIGMIFMFGFGIFMVVNQYREHVKFGMDMSVDNILFNYSILIGILCAAVVSLFLGTEYSDGTIRNKLVAGHTRKAIYLSSLTVSVCAGVFLCLSYLLGVLIVGIPVIGVPQMDGKRILVLILLSIVMVVAFGSILTLVSMLIQSKAIVSVVSILGIFVLLFAASYINVMLDSPEYYDGYQLVDSEGNMETEKIKNPMYLKGVKRDVYEFMLDFLPTGQSLQIGSATATHLWQMPLYSLVITGLTTAAGLCLFRKKDIK